MLATAVLCAVGLTVAHTTGLSARPGAGGGFAKVAVLTAAGVFTALVLSQLPARWVERSGFPLLLLTFALLATVLVPGVGVSAGGATRWLRVGPISVQPSELAKLAVPLYLAGRVSPGFAFRFVKSVPRLWPVPIVAGLVVCQPDLSTTLVLLLGVSILLFLRGWPMRFFVAAAVPVVGGVAATLWLRPYQWERVRGLAAVWTDPSAAPYQVRQSLLALGAGGPTGTGLGRGWQKLGFLPEAEDDFAFAALGEELGFVGTAGLLAVWAAFTLCGMKLAAACEHPIRRALAGTLVLQTAGQALLNVGVVTALLPPTGLPHPFVSRGGSSLLVTLATAGVVLAVTRAETSISRDQRERSRWSRPNGDGSKSADGGGADEQ